MLKILKTSPTVTEKYPKNSISSCMERTITLKDIIQTFPWKTFHDIDTSTDGS